MNTMPPARPAGWHARCARLTPGPAAAAGARRQVRAAICARNAPVGPDAAALLASELVTNTARHTAGDAVTLGIR